MSEPLLSKERIVELALISLQADYRPGDVMTSSIKRAIDQAVREAGEAAWQTVNTMITDGQLSRDDHERRNGLVIAANAIKERIS
jgi:hypothetical protein